MTTFETNCDPDVLLTERQVAQFTNFKPKTFQAWRIRGGGPRFIRISARAIRYRRGDLIAWINERVKTSTSDMGTLMPDRDVS